jgi:hypothetical protein
VPFDVANCTDTAPVDPLVRVTAIVTLPALSDAPNDVWLRLSTPAGAVSSSVIDTETDPGEAMEAPPPTLVSASVKPSVPSRVASWRIGTLIVFEVDSPFAHSSVPDFAV